MPNLRQVGQHINAQLLATERLANDAIPQPSLVDHMQQPRFIHGQRIAGLRLSDPRVLALLQALCQVAPRPGGFRHRDLRPIVAGLLGRDLEHYSAGAMTYDLRRLRLHGLIERVPHSFRYTLTAMDSTSPSASAASSCACSSPHGLTYSPQTLICQHQCATRSCVSMPPF